MTTPSETSKLDLLNQINKAAPFLKTSKEDLLQKAKQQMLEGARGGVTSPTHADRNHMDLLSNVSYSRAGGAPADIANQQDFEVRRILKARGKSDLDIAAAATGYQSKYAQEDLRSLRSEYDYKNQKNFTNVLAQAGGHGKPTQKQLAHLRNEFGSQRNSRVNEFSLIQSSQRSGISRVTAINSLRNQAVKANQTVDILKGANRTATFGQKDSDETLDVPKLIDDLLRTLNDCVQCTKALTNDERIINARFVHSAVAANEDISVFPVCTRCNFQSIMNSQPLEKRRNSGQPSPTQMSQTHSNMFRNGNYANKTLTDVLNNDTSDDFKQLGTLDSTNRQVQYYPNYMQPSKVHPPPQYFGAEESLKDAGFGPASYLGPNDDSSQQGLNRTIELTGVGSNRAVIHPQGQQHYQIARQLADENFMAAIERQQQQRVARNKDKKSCHASVAAKSISQVSYTKTAHGQVHQSDLQESNYKDQELNQLFSEPTFPQTTNQEHLNAEIHSMRSKNMDKNHFKKRNSFSTYVNSTFNQGVFNLPWNDMH